jgi:hypothetical protein
MVFLGLPPYFNDSQIQDYSSEETNPSTVIIVVHQGINRPLPMMEFQKLKSQQ